jgi:LuxR family quorum-sensing system transcriptional regulator CciR
VIVRDVVRVVSERIRAFVDDARAVSTVSDLQLLLTDISAELGFSHFALVHHVDLKKASGTALRVHNYPCELERFHDEQRLGSCDPVHRACQRTAVGFTWAELPELIPLTSRDLRVLDAAASQGIGDGFTVPAHVPGELSASCSFATSRGVRMQHDNLTMAHLAGAFALQAARRLLQGSDPNARKPVHLSERERECLIWVARGKSDFEIAMILGISPETVHQYMKHARAMYDVVSRSQLVVQALSVGTINFLEIGER